MLISEIILRKEYAEDKLGELQRYLDSNNSDAKQKISISNLMFEILGEIQSYKILLNSENNRNNIKIQDTEISVSNALKVLDTLDNKIKILTDMISCGTVDIFNVIGQRDKLFEECIVLLSAIKVKDWITDVK